MKLVLCLQLKARLTGWLQRPAIGDGALLAPFLRNKIAQLVVLVVQVVSTSCHIIIPLPLALVIADRYIEEIKQPEELSSRDSLIQQLHAAVPSFSPVW